MLQQNSCLTCASEFLPVASQWPSPVYICSLWPERAVERYEGPFNKTLANPILVIGNTVRAGHLAIVLLCVDVTFDFSMTPSPRSSVRKLLRTNLETLQGWSG